MALPRGLRIVLVFIALAVFVSIAGTILMYFAVARGPSVPGSATLVLRPGGELREIAPDDVVGQLLGRDGQTVRAFWDSLRKAARDERITTVLLVPGTLALPYWAKVQELRDAVLEFRRSGKKVIAFLEYGGDREYYLASAADRVYLLPTSPLDLTGVASYEIFLRGTLERIGAYPDFLQIGDYKTAPNQLTERGFTPAHREMAVSLNRDMYEQLVRAIAEARRKNDAEVRALIDRGPLTPEDALRAGLVDDLAYEDQLDDRAPELRDGSRERRRVEGADYARVPPAAAGLRPRSRIAVLYAVGTIVSGRSRFDPINGQLVGSETLVEQIRDIRDDESIRAIVLRIDSPGGSAVASDVIWRELTITRRARPSRPLVASMSDLAASGGYYIALPAQAIVAQPATLTGSIGVFAGKIALGGTLEKLGVGYETVTSGANADIYSPFDRFEPGARARIEEYMQVFYQGFVKKAAESRAKTPEQIDAVAQGRVWTGQQAREHGLVDALGGLQAAVEIAKARAGIPAGEDVELVIYPPRRSLYQLLSERLAGAGAGGAWAALAGGAERRALAALSAPARLF
ncbi:MAG TPA: signal peptide peptidase SppA, partial [Vicinamibacterales bacterium]|nr:signal peptide peptidase SppA [Vicinamibacterales bacterium]